LKSITLKLFPYTIGIIFFFPILKQNISTATFLLLAFNLIIYKILNKDYSYMNKKNLLLTIPFWLIAIKSIWSVNFTESMIHVNHAAFFLVFPLFFSLIPKENFSLQKLNLYFTILKNVCLLIALLYIFSFIYHFPINKINEVSYNSSFFRNYIYKDFKLFIIHPTYYTSILILCTAHSLHLILNQNKYIQILYVISFVIISFLLSTKLNIVILTILIIYMVINNLHIKKSITSYFGLLGILISLTILFIYTPGIKNRFTEVYTDFNKKPEGMYFNSTNVRKAIFECDISLIKDNWIKGVGFENLQNQLNSSYKSRYNSSFYELITYMTHNYYFYILISSGIVGFIFYLFYLFYLIKICLKSNLFLFKVFLFNALIICFVEDYFYRQHGALYFNLVLLCFIKHLEYNNQNQIDLNAEPS
jgi:O-antigen ligase